MQEYATPVYTQPLKKLRPYGAEQKRLFLTATVLGLGLLLYVALSSALSSVLVSDPSLYDRYRNGGAFSLIFDMTYTSVAVFLPFCLVYGLLRAMRLSAEIPLGGVYHPRNAALLVLAAIACCFIGDIGASWLSVVLDSFGLEFYSMQVPVEAVDLSPGMIILLLLRSAVFPALFEEFAYRGVVMQTLRRYGDRFAIVVSAFLFGMMHGNMLQVPFAFAIGLVLGYCTTVTGSLWIGIAIHFFNNFFACMQQIVLSAYGETAALAFMSILMYGMIAVGVICFFIYCASNRNIFRLRASRFLYMRHKGKLVLLAPTVLFSVAYFTYAVLMDVVGFYEWFASSLQNLFGMI